MKHIKLFEQFINEGVHDPGILKAFFMAGGPGSGKSYIASEIFSLPQADKMQTVSYATGLKLVNNDDSFERNMKKAGYDIGKISKYAQDEDVWADIMVLRDKAKNTTRNRQNNYIGGRLGQIIDGTGKNYNRIKGHRNLYKDFGYDTYMIFVNTPLEVALDRNQMRDRKLPPDIVTKMWEEVQQNLGKFQKLFGSNNMIIVDNSSYDNGDILRNIEKEIRKKIKQPVKNHLGKRWIKEMSAPYAKDKNRPAK